MNAGGGLDRLLGGLQSVLELAIASLEAEEHPVCGAALHSYSEVCAPQAGGFESSQGIQGKGFPKKQLRFIPHAGTGAALLGA
jgi:hypothetical protein